MVVHTAASICCPVDADNSQAGTDGGENSGGIVKKKMKLVVCYIFFLMNWGDIIERPILK